MPSRMPTVSSVSTVAAATMFQPKYQPLALPCSIVPSPARFDPGRTIGGGRASSLRKTCQGSLGGWTFQRGDAEDAEDAEKHSD